MFRKIILSLLLCFSFSAIASAELNPETQEFLKRFKDQHFKRQQALIQDHKKLIDQTKIFTEDINTLIEAGKCEQALEMLEGKYYSDNPVEINVARTSIYLLGFRGGNSSVQRCIMPLYLRLPALIESYASILDIRNKTEALVKFSAVSIASEQLSNILGKTWLPKVSQLMYQPFPLEAAFQNLLCAEQINPDKETLLKAILRDGGKIATQKRISEEVLRLSSQNGLCLVEVTGRNMDAEACFWLEVSKTYEDEYTYWSFPQSTSRLSKMSLMFFHEKFTQESQIWAKELREDNISLVSDEANRGYHKLRVNFVHSYCPSYLGEKEYAKVQERARDFVPITLEELLSEFPQN